MNIATELRDASSRNLSGGEAARVNLARAIYRLRQGNLKILLLDEPTSGLDPRATADFNALVTRLKARGTAILMVTHDLLGAADCADRIGFLAAGQIVEEVIPSKGMDVLALHHRYGEVAAA